MIHQAQLKAQEEIEAAKFNLRVKNDFNSDKQLLVQKNAWEKIVSAVPPYGSYVASIRSLGDLRQRRLLEIGCGTGWLSVIFCKLGANLEAIDISNASVEIAKKRAVVNMVQERVTFKTMSAHNLAYEDESFDLIYGPSILHHVNVKKTINEVKRVLKKGGKAVFLEPVNSIGFVESVRKLVPVSYDHDPEVPAPPLSDRDIQFITSNFERGYVSSYRFFSSLDRVIDNQKFIRLSERLDAVFLQFSLLRKLGRQAAMELHN